jgi:hypothetical protein
MFTKFSLAIAILMGFCSGSTLLYSTEGQMQTIDDTYLYSWLLIIIVLFLLIAGIRNTKIYQRISKWLAASLTALKSIRNRTSTKKITGDASIDNAITAAGYSYDAKQDIFYSMIDAWQRDMGYCRLYDESAAPLNMIIDCEPIYFNYAGKRWLIEFWKGQYALTCGGEIGVYSTEEPDLRISGVFVGTFYQCARDTDLLKMSYSLMKNGKLLFRRKDKHWWLTGFKLGEFSEPNDLTMNLSITLIDSEMRDAFIGGLKRAGYSKHEITVNRNTVSLNFKKTRTKQPYTRTPQTDWIIQKKNKLLCDKYQELTGPYNNFSDKVKAIQEASPELYKEILNIGKTRQLFSMFDKIKGYIK